MKRYKILGGLLLASFIAVAGNGTWGCGTSTATRGTTTNELSSAFPSDLAVSSPTASTGSSSALLAALGFKSQTATVTPENFLDKKGDIGNLIDFADEATFTTELAEMKDEINIFASAPSATCYGPNLNYVNHPDATGGEVDADSTDGTNDDDGQLPPGDLGIWTATETTTG